MLPKTAAMLACLAMQLAASALGQVPPAVAAVGPTGGPEPDLADPSDDPFPWSTATDALDRPATRFQARLATLTEREDAEMWAHQTLHPLGLHVGFSRRTWVYDTASGMHFYQLRRREVVVGVPLVLAVTATALAIGIYLRERGHRRGDGYYDYYTAV